MFKYCTRTDNGRRWDIHSDVENLPKPGTSWIYCTDCIADVCITGYADVCIQVTWM